APPLEDGHLGGHPAPDGDAHQVAPGRPALAGAAPPALERRLVEFVEHGLDFGLAGLLGRRSRPATAPGPTATGGGGGRGGRRGGGGAGRGASSGPSPASAAAAAPAG